MIRIFVEFSLDFWAVPSFFFQYWTFSSIETFTKKKYFFCLTCGISLYCWSCGDIRWFPPSTADAPSNQWSGGAESIFNKSMQSAWNRPAAAGAQSLLLLLLWLRNPLQQAEKSRSCDKKARVTRPDTRGGWYSLFGRAMATKPQSLADSNLEKHNFGECKTNQSGKKNTFKKRNNQILSSA